ncbi:MAG: hypothetical protein R6W90_07550, partial [Ignavibacteriaceae bacterium]
MIKIYLIILLSLIFNISSNAQTPWGWKKTQDSIVTAYDSIARLRNDINLVEYKLQPDAYYAEVGGDSTNYPLTLMGL